MLPKKNLNAREALDLLSGDESDHDEDSSRAYRLTGQPPTLENSSESATLNDTVLSDKDGDDDDSTSEYSPSEESDSSTDVII